MKQKEQEAQDAVQELFASDDDSDDDEGGPEDTDNKSKVSKAKKAKYYKKGQIEGIPGPQRRRLK